MSIGEMQLLGLAALLATVYLLRQFAKSLAEGAINEHVGKALQDHRQAFERDLERHRDQQSRELTSLRQALDLQTERFTKDYGLHAERRNVVYADLFAKLERARGAYATLAAPLRIGPNFSSANVTDIVAYVTNEAHMLESEKHEISALATAGNVVAVRSLAAELELRALQRRADQCYRDWKNEWIVQALFLSNEVEELLRECNQLLAKMSAELFPPGAPPNWPNRQALAQSLDATTVALRKQMKSEMTSAFTNE